MYCQATKSPTQIVNTSVSISFCFTLYVSMQYEAIIYQKQPIYYLNFLTYAIYSPSMNGFFSYIPRRRIFSNLFLQVSKTQLFVPIGILIVPLKWNLQQQVKKALYLKKNLTTHCSNCFANSRPSASNYLDHLNIFSHSMSEQFSRQNTIFSFCLKAQKKTREEALYSSDSCFLTDVQKSQLLDFYLGTFSFYFLYPRDRRFKV